MSRRNGDKLLMGKTEFLSSEAEKIESKRVEGKWGA
jgi:hypothetical protein